MIGKFTAEVNGNLTGRRKRRLAAVSSPMLGEVLERIERRLVAVGLTATAASRAAGLSEDAIRNLRRAKKSGGHQGLSTRTIAALAPVLKTTPAWLLTGEGDEAAVDAGTVPVVGYVGAGAAAHFYDAAQGPFDRVEAPEDATENTVAAWIKGPSVGRFFDGWLLFYDNVQSHVSEDMYGELCVVGLPDDRILVKQIQASKTPGLYHLFSENEPPILDQAVAWAALVTGLRRR